MHVVKRIPLGGGLGGGSTDAAAVLRWAGCHDLDVARSLGSDVPFSVAGGRALVEATGEKVTPLPFEARSFLLLVPPFGVNTALVYGAWDELTGVGLGTAGRPVTTGVPMRSPMLRWRSSRGWPSGATPWAS